MKILEIRENKGFFRFSEDSEWQPIDGIDKDGILTLLNVLLENEVSMDVPTEDNLGNQAHSIIYRNIYSKFVSLLGEKSRFQDESQRLYIDEIKKYVGQSDQQ
ncbi:hypothetical protein AAG612_04080 [Citromicrobium bathyomarinum]|uniref:hypothetical protein n=1 Tax=Citromicrobium bathyomarinum TaxID=72174 RepID=UPI003159D785